MLFRQPVHKVLSCRTAFATERELLLNTALYTALSRECARVHMILERPSGISRGMMALSRLKR
jgi:hypothetical protein